MIVSRNLTNEKISQQFCPSYIPLNFWDTSFLTLMYSFINFYLYYHLNLAHSELRRLIQMSVFNWVLLTQESNYRPSHQAHSWSSLVFCSRSQNHYEPFRVYLMKIFSFIIGSNQTWFKNVSFIFYSKPMLKMTSEIQTRKVTDFPCVCMYDRNRRPVATSFEPQGFGTGTPFQSL